jgi:hypothetical protein
MQPLPLTFKFYVVGNMVKSEAEYIPKKIITKTVIIPSTSGLALMSGPNE